MPTLEAYDDTLILVQEQSPHVYFKIIRKYLITTRQLRSYVVNK